MIIMMVTTTAKVYLSLTISINVSVYETFLPRILY